MWLITIEINGIDFPISMCRKLETHILISKSFIKFSNILKILNDYCVRTAMSLITIFLMNIINELHQWSSVGR